MNDDRKKELLTKFNLDEEMKEAVKEELLTGLYTNGVIREGVTHNALKNAAFTLAMDKEHKYSDEQLGQDLRGLAEGVRCVESAFKRIEDNYKPTQPSEDKGNENPGR